MSPAYFSFSELYTERRLKPVARNVSKTVNRHHPYAFVPAPGSRHNVFSRVITGRPQPQRPIKLPMNPPPEISRPRISGLENPHTVAMVADHLKSNAMYKANPDTQRECPDATTEIITRPSEVLSPAVSHLRSYIRGAFLPSILWDEGGCGGIPRRGQRSYLNWLQIPFNTKRKIDTITTIPIEELKAGIDYFTRNHIYDSPDLPPAGFMTESLLSTSTEALTVPSILYRPTIQLLQPERVLSLPAIPGNLEELVTWIVEQPLRTVQRALHLAHPETAEWWFDQDPLGSGEEWRNKELCSVYVWRRHTSLEKNIEITHNYLAVIVQPPWILTWKDFQDVVECKDLPLQPNPFATSFQHRVWSLVHDTCKRLNTKYFILTTYEGWVFGTFDTPDTRIEIDSSNLPVLSAFDMSIPLFFPRLPATHKPEDPWSRCSISRLMESTSRLPSVVESILYWVATSMELKGSHKMSNSNLELTSDETAQVSLENRMMGTSVAPHSLTHDSVSSQPSSASSSGSSNLPFPSPSTTRGRNLKVENTATGAPLRRAKRDKRVHPYSPYPLPSSRDGPIRVPTKRDDLDSACNRTHDWTSGLKSLFTATKRILGGFKNGRLSGNADQ